MEARLPIDHSLSNGPAQWSRKAYALELADARIAMPEGETVMAVLRCAARY